MAEMLKQLDLDYSDIENMTIQHGLPQDINELLNSMESEIVEKSDSDKVSLET